MIWVWFVLILLGIGVGADAKTSRNYTGVYCYTLLVLCIIGGAIFG